MKIKTKNNPLISGKVGDAFRRRKRLPAIVLGLGGMIGSVILFFAVFNYGGYLYKSGQTQHFKQMLSDMVSFDFSFMTNYMKGQTAELDDVKIDMKFKHMLRIQYLREQAVKSKYIDNIYKDEEFPAQLTFNGKQHDVKLSLTGKVSRTHLGNPSKWSFQIKVRGDDTIEGMKRFGVLVPTARGNLTDWLSFELLKERGLMGLRIDYVNVTINGKPSGVFYMEERFDKHLVENNRLREGIIFKLDKDVLPYQESKLMAAPATRAHLLLLKRMWHDVMAGNMPAEKFFDMDKMAKVLMISDLMNNRHPLSRANLRFYFNPVTSLVEPIAREFEDISKSDPATMNMFLEEPDIYSRQFWLSQEKIIGMVYRNEVFQRYYMQEAEEISQKKYLDEFFARKKDKLDAITGKLYKTWPYYKLPQEIMYANQDYIRSVLYPKRPQLIASFENQDAGYINIHLQNQQDLPLEISHLSWGETALYPAQPVVLDAEFRTGRQGGQVAKFQLPSDVSWSENMLPELKVHFNLLGLEPGQKSVSVSTPQKENLANQFEGKTFEDANYTAFKFIEESEDGKMLSIPAGRWKLSKKLVIPQGKYLQIEAGAEIDLVKGAEIISYSPVYSQGTENKSVLFYSSDATGEGLSVIQVNQRSTFSYTNMNGTLTFYESPVNITDCNFANIEQGKTLIHLTRSDFLIDKSTFQEVKTNALKSDFCTGTIRQTSFVNIGNNGLDFSGSEIELSNVFLKGIGTQALIAREGSRLSVQWLDIRNSDAGIVASDQTEVSLSEVQVWNSRIGIALLTERQAFGPATLTVSQLDIKQVEVPYLIEENASLRVNGKAEVSAAANVKEVLEGAKNNERTF